jgi:hypothetical protein
LIITPPLHHSTIPLKPFLLSLLLTTAAFAADDTFTPLFNGRDLTGWDGDPKLWKVENGLVSGTNPAPEAMANNSFLIWRGGKVNDFELRATIRVIGDNNSGIQYRRYASDSSLVCAPKSGLCHWQSTFYEDKSNPPAIVQMNALNAQNCTKLHI